MFQSILTVRFIMLFATLGAMLGAALMFLVGGVKLIKAAASLAGLADLDLKTITATIMGSIDAFLFGVVLMIFAYAIAFGFVFNVEGTIADRLPTWTRVDGVGELKHTLIITIIVYLVVDFATDVAVGETHLSWEALVLPLSIVLIAAASGLISGRHPKHDATGSQN